MKYSIPLFKANQLTENFTTYSEQALEQMADSHKALDYDKKKKMLWLNIDTDKRNRRS